MTATGPQRDLHVRRIRESVDQIASWRQKQAAPHTPEFQTWRQRVQHSLSEVFGSQSQYTRRFSNLHFCLPRVSLDPGMPSWTREDESACREDLQKAHDLLKDALEEVEVAPAAPPAQLYQTAAQFETPPIVVQVLNVLSQSNSIDVKQIAASIDALPLDQETKQAAREHVRLLEEEARGKHRWAEMGKSLDFLKGLGKGVYEKVALPLVLEIIKKQVGLSGP